MITAEEREEIIAEAIERTLLAIPDVVGNLMVNQAMMIKNNKKFYDKYPEFKSHKDLVSSVIEMTEGSNPLEDHEKVLEKAVPEIRKRLMTLNTLDVVTVSSNPDLGAF